MKEREREKREKDIRVSPSETLSVYMCVMGVCEGGGNLAVRGLARFRSL